MAAGRIRIRFAPNSGWRNSQHPESPSSHLLLAGALRPERARQVRPALVRQQQRGRLLERHVGPHAHLQNAQPAPPAPTARPFPSSWETRPPSTGLPKTAVTAARRDRRARERRARERGGRHHRPERRDRADERGAKNAAASRRSTRTADARLQPRRPRSASTRPRAPRPDRDDARQDGRSRRPQPADRPACETVGSTRRCRPARSC